MTSSRAGDSSELLAHLGWVQRLARVLVRDAASADDLAQEAVRVTLEQPHGRVGSGAMMKSWLGGVVRRLALDRFRSDRSRAARELEVAPREPAPDTFEVVARSARQQRVAQAVHELAEPYRSTILYRYLDELSTREVAARTGVSEEVVRKRLERGLAQLRERLDSEFGSDTRNWAIALIGLPGAVVMGAATKLSIAAIALVGAVVGWRVFVASPPTRLQDDAGARTLTHSVAAEERALPATDPATSVASAERMEQPGERESQLVPPNSATVLRVRVVDSEGKPQRKGRLDCLWIANSSFAHQDRARVIDVQIAGEVTEIELPVGAGSAELRASVEGLPPSPRVEVDRLRLLGAGEPIPSRVVRDVTIRIGDALDEPRITGTIRVDGERRVPRGLNIRLEPPHEPARIHALEARYEAGPAPYGDAVLWVTSDESVPQTVAIRAGDRVVDLDLHGERELVLRVVDLRHGRPLPDVELFVQVQALLEREAFRAHYRDDWRFVTTDAAGIATIRGLPSEGQVSIRRDERTKDVAVAEQGGAMRISQALREPLLIEKLDPKSAKRIEATLRLDLSAGDLALRGRVDTRLLAASGSADDSFEVAFASCQADGIRTAGDRNVNVAADGAFEFPIEAGRDYLVWAERDGIRASAVATVKVGAVDPEPVLLVPREGAEVTLRILHCPAEGFVSIYVHDPQIVGPHGEVVSASGGTIERKFRIEEKTWGNIGFERVRGERSGPVHLLDLDPASAPIVIVDLAENSPARPVLVALSDGTPIPLGQLNLMPIGESKQGSKLGTMHVSLKEGECTRPTSVPSGRYLAVLFGVPGIVMDVIEVVAGPADVPLEIMLLTERHPRADLGVGVRLKYVPDEELRDWMLVINQGEWRWADLHIDDSASELVLPKDATFDVLAD